LRTIRDSFEDPPRANLLSAATHPFYRPEDARRFAATRNRLASVAADLRQLAQKDFRAKDELVSLACKLDAMATEDTST